jgi:PPOX class probable F420-dependent enzyme
MRHNLLQEDNMAATIGDVITPGNEKAFTVKDTKPGALKDLGPQYTKLLSDPVTASLTTVNDKGEMQVTPVWVGNDGTHIELNSARGRLKDRNLRGNGQVTLLLMNPANPYHWMSINGKVVDIIDEDDKARGHLATKSIDGLALRYVNQTPYPFRDPKGEVRVLYKVEPTQILTFGTP